MPEIKESLVIPINPIDRRLEELAGLSDKTVENFEWLFRCSHFFETRTNVGWKECMNEEERGELISILDTMI